jgi:hypothetical protein
MSTTYSFNQQLFDAEGREKELDDFYSKWFDIMRVSRENQSLGMDRIFYEKGNGVVRSVEYKTDKTAITTGNVFIETVSVDTQNKKGWAYTSCAQYLFIYVPPPHGKVYITHMQTIKAMVDKWKAKYRDIPIKNEGYYTHGVAVPISEFKTYCFRIDDIADGSDEGKE